MIYYSYGTTKPVIEVYYTYNDLGILSTKKSITYTCTDCEYFDEEIAKSYPYVDIVKYDEFGNEIEFLRYKSQNVLIDKTVSKYKASLKIATSRYKDNEEIFRANFSYNEKGLLIYEQNQDFKSNSQYDISYQYEYYE